MLGIWEDVTRYMEMNTWMGTLVTLSASPESDPPSAAAVTSSADLLESFSPLDSPSSSAVCPSLIAGFSVVLGLVVDASGALDG